MPKPEILNQIDAPRLVTVAEMQQIERQSDAIGHSYAAMMEIAGRAVAQVVAKRWEEVGTPVLILGQKHRTPTH